MVGRWFPAHHQNHRTLLFHICNFPNQCDQKYSPKVSQIGPKWDKSRTFSDQISVHFGLLKSPGFVLFRTNLTHFGPKSGHPEVLPISAICYFNSLYVWWLVTISFNLELSYFVTKLIIWLISSQTLYRLS